MLQSERKFGIRNIAFIGLSIALITICSWISIPSTVPFTLQTFAIFLVLYLFGGRDGLIATIAYILLGMVGVPVFSNFGGGLGVIAGPTGGYILGFLFVCGIYWLFSFLFKEKLWSKVTSSIIGLVVCYLFGTIWFVLVYNKGSSISFGEAFSICVIPFIIPDLIKIGLALYIDNRLNKIINRDKEKIEKE